MACWAVRPASGAPVAAASVHKVVAAVANRFPPSAIGASLTRCSAAAQVEYVCRRPMCADVTRDALTAEDVRILALETARVAGHTLKVMVLDRGGELGVEELREWVGARIGRLPRLTQRLELQPDGGPPSWVPDRDFDLTRHVRRAEGAGTLPAAVAPIMERRLDRRAPLWSIELADAGADGSASC